MAKDCVLSFGLCFFLPLGVLFLWSTSAMLLWHVSTGAASSIQHGHDA